MKTMKKKRARSRIFFISSVSVSCAAGTGGTRNVTVTATGVASPLGPPATSTMVPPTPIATLLRGGSPVDQKAMTAHPSIVGKWEATFFGQPAGPTYTANVSVTWQINFSETKSTLVGCT